MGFPIMHSRSPAIHNYWLAEYGLLGHYAPLAIRPEQLEKALRALPALGFRGVNLTIPLKELAMPFLDEIDPVARAIGAVNCVVAGEDEELRGYNYDAFGFVEALREGAPGWRADQGPALVLGAGGAARAIIAGLIGEGAKEIRLANRTYDRALRLASEFGKPVCAVPWEESSQALGGATLLVNTTSMGMSGQPPLEIVLDDLAPGAVVNDIVYVPLETDLLARARLRGARTVDGLGMLLHQARPAFRDWFGPMPKVTPALRRRIEASL